MSGELERHNVGGKVGLELMDKVRMWQHFPHWFVSPEVVSRQFTRAIWTFICLHDSAFMDIGHIML